MRCSHPLFLRGLILCSPPPRRSPIASTKASRLRTASRYQQYQSGDTASITEASFQYDVLAVATFNGWSISLPHTIPDDQYERFAVDSPWPTAALKLRDKLRRCFPKRGLAKPYEYLMGKRRHQFTLAYHTHDSRNSQKGFPDLCMVHPERNRIIFAELKNDHGYPTDEQRMWAAALLCVQDEYPDAVTYRLWRPKHYAQVVETLGGLDPLTYL